MIVLLAVLLLAAAGVGLYLNQRDTLTRAYTSGSKSAAAVKLMVDVQQVDLAADELVLRVTPDLPSSLLASDGTPAKPVTIGVPSESTPELHLAAGKTITGTTIKAPFGGGTVTDYPFDHYVAALAFGAAQGDHSLPLRVKLSELDPFFLTKITFKAAGGGIVLDLVRISRSRGTFILAWFMMVAMWALALSVLGGAYVIVRRRMGMVWPALAWMAATLFALVGLRNAAPEGPPIGSLIDYASFFWAEAIIAASLAVVVVTGIRAEHAAAAKERS